MATIYYVETTRWNDGKYQQEVEQIFYGEKPQFVEEHGRYTGYSLETEPGCTDQRWIVGNTREEMIRGGLIQAPSQAVQAPSEDSVAQPVAEGPAPDGVALVGISLPYSFGSECEVRALLSGSDEMQYSPLFASEDEAMAYIVQAYPSHQLVSANDLYVEYRARVARSGRSFEDRARLWR